MSMGGGYYQQKEITIGTVDNERVFYKPQEGNARTYWHIDGDASLRPRHDLRYALRLSYTNAEITDTAAMKSDGYFAGSATTTAFLAAGASISWDTRDSRAFARTGTYADLKIDRLGLGLLGENEPDITTLFGSLKRWWTLGKRTGLALGAAGKTTIGGTVPYFVQEGLGYRHTVRGYEYYVNDGQHYAMGRANFLLTLVQPRDYYMAPVPLEAFRTLHVALYLDLFTDVGRVWDDQYAELNPLNDEWLAGFGLGLDLVSSYDQVIRLEYSLNALGEDGVFLHFTQPF
jgi:outer membrane protein assembly factor BamA